MHIAIIGAGAAGLASARHATDSKYNFTCEIFEQTDELGGTWVYTDRVGVDEYGLPVHTSMYQGLMTNLPKELMDFPDFKFPEMDNSYISQQQVLDYLHSYAEHYKIKPLIKYRHFVREIRPLPKNRWLVIVTDLCIRKTIEKEFDAILICNGHYSKPFIPNIQGNDVFKGKIIHSHDYRRADDFYNQTVLVVGGGPSGMDIAYQLANKGSNVILSSKQLVVKIQFPKNVEQKPPTVQFTEKGAIFKDGSIADIDAVIYCTGFEYSFPFLTKESNITVKDNFVQPLYKQIVNIERPTMGFIGIPFTVLPFLMFDYQVRLFLNHLNGTITLPSRAEMLLDTEQQMNKRWEKGFPKKHAHKLGAEFQAEYFTDLAQTAQIIPILPVKLKLYAVCSMKLNRSNVFRIVDDENFIKLK